MTVKEAYDKGWRDALTTYAVWKDGVQYVGMGGPGREVNTVLKQFERCVYYAPPREHPLKAKALPDYDTFRALCPQCGGAHRYAEEH